MKFSKIIRKRTILFGSLLAFFILFSGLPAAHAASPSLLPNDPEKIEDLMASRLKKKLREGTYFLLGIDKKIAQSREELQILKSNETLLESKIEESKIRIGKLESQVSNLDRLIIKNEGKIRAAEIQKARLENEIFLMEKDMHTLNDLLKKNIAALNESISAYYFQTNTLFENFGGDPSLLAFLAQNDSIGDVLKTQEYLGFLKQASEELAKEILKEQDALDEKETRHKETIQKLAELDGFLNQEKTTLTQAQESRKRLIRETKGKQAIYETLLELSKKEEQQVAQEIIHLKENFAFFQKKLDELKQNPALSGEAARSITLSDTDPLMLGTSQLAWPVSSSGGLSALFHDSDYKKALKVEHNAIDIRVVQGSKIKAAADGVVTKAVDNGFAYSYIIIAHPDKILTLYGHVSEILVEEGEIVRQGQVIGLSGGIPGTKGAGWLTTGAHLHFEVFKDFVHTDPLEYLPLEYVPVSSLPEKYLKKLSGELEKVKRE